MKLVLKQPINIRFVWCVVILVFLVANLLPTAALALSNEQKNLFNKNVLYYDLESCGPAGGGDADTNLLGSDNAEKIFNFYVTKGYTPEQAAGFVGNYFAESGLDPAKQQTGGNGFGLAQWDDRRTTLERYASQKGRSVNSLSLQLDFSIYELTGSETAANNALKAVKGSGQTTVEKATLVIRKTYERPGIPRDEVRISAAREAYTKFKGNTPSTASSSEDSVDICDVSSAGNTDFINDFTVYSQYDAKWKDKPYSSSTIGVSGCGPSAMAMVVTALTGKKITPVDTADYAASKGQYVKGAGSKWTISPVLAEHWGLNAKQIKPSVPVITKTLQSGGLVITAGQGSEPFTSGGHFIVIRGVTSDGKFMIGDSGHAGTSEKKWNPDELVSKMHDGSVYAITK